MRGGGLEGRLVSWSAGGGGGNGTEEMWDYEQSGVERNTLTTDGAHWRLASHVSGYADNRMLFRLL